MYSPIHEHLWAFENRMLANLLFFFLDHEKKSADVASVANRS